MFKKLKMYNFCYELSHMNCKYYDFMLHQIVSFVSRTNLNMFTFFRMDYNNFEQVPKEIKQRFFKTSYFQVGEQTSRVCLYYKVPEEANKVSGNCIQNYYKLIVTRFEVLFSNYEICKPPFFSVF